MHIFPTERWQRKVHMQLGSLPSHSRASIFMAHTDLDHPIMFESKMVKNLRMHDRMMVDFRSQKVMEIYAGVPISDISSFSEQCMRRKSTTKSCNTKNTAWLNVGCMMWGGRGGTASSAATMPVKIWRIASGTAGINARASLPPIWGTLRNAK